MQKTWNKFTSLVIACVMMIASMFAVIATLVMPQTTAVAAETATYKKVTEAPTDWSGDYLIVYEAGNVALDGSRTSTSNPKLDADNNTVPITITNNEITATDAMNAIAFTIESNGDNYAIKSASGVYIGRNSNSNGLDISNAALTNSITYQNGQTIITSSAGPKLQVYVSGTNYRFRYYASTQKPIALYKLDEGGTVVVPDDIKTALNGVEASMSLSYKYTKSTNTVDASQGAELSFADKTNRTEFSTSKQVWEENGIIVTNNKGSGSNVADYANPVRFYKNSELIVTYESAMTKIEFTCSSSSYATALKNSIGDSATANGTVVTVELNEVNTFTVILSDNQVRMTSLKVYGGSAEVTTLGDSEFRIRFSVNASSLSAIKDIIVDGGNLTTDYGIRVSTGSKTKLFSFKDETAVDGKYYVIISLGDIINDTEKLTTDFTVQAYITYSGSEVTPDKPAEGETTNAIKTHSVKSMVAAYYDGEKATAETTAKVAHLHTYLTTGEF